MSPPFHRLTLPEFATVLDRFPFTRRINAVHLHHTRRPNHGQYRGHESIVDIWRYQTQTDGLSDVAHHLAVAPDGRLWTGRNWNQPPASAAGHNRISFSWCMMCGSDPVMANNGANRQEHGGRLMERWSQQRYIAG